MENIRIDKGVKRGPRKQSAPAKRDRHTSPVSWSIPPHIDPDAILQLLLAGHTTGQIATSMHVARSALSKWLRDTVPDKWRAVQIARALDRKERADEGIEIAPDALALARAREMLRSGQWELERLDSSNYGQKQQVTLDINVDLGDRLLRAEQRVIHIDAPQLTQCDADITDAVEIEHKPELVTDQPVTE